MPDLVITSSEVKFGTDADTIFEQLDSGEVIDAGELVYMDKADSNKLKLADASAADSSIVRGMAVSGATAADQKLVIQRNNKVTTGANAGAVQAKQHFLSETPGKITDTAPVTSGAFVVPVGQGAASNQFDLGIDNSELAVA